MDADAPAGVEKRRVIEWYFPVHKPRWSYVLVGLLALIWVALEAVGVLVFGVRNATEDGLFMLIFGAKYNPLITAGEWWRLLTAAFLHFGLLHLLANCFALYQLGPAIERFFGRDRFLVIYLLAGLYGNVASYLLADSLSAGASGAVLGLLGAFIAYLRRYQRLFGQSGQAMLRWMLATALFNLVYGLTAGRIDNFAHAGGFLAGLILGQLLTPRYAQRMRDDGAVVWSDISDRRRTWWAAALGLLGVIAAAALGAQLGR